MEQSLDSTGYQLEHENIEIVKDLDREIPKTMVDPVHIQQVFTSIILIAEQAITASSERGQLSVSTGLNGDGAIEIAFTDNGPDIAKDLMGKEFDPFITTKELGKGIGLGSQSLTESAVSTAGRYPR